MLKNPQFKILILSFLSFTFGENTDNSFFSIDGRELIIKNNILYTKKPFKPYTGNMISYFENGKTSYKGNIEEGKKHGYGISYYENGQIEFEVNYKDGIKHGKRTLYYESGEIWEEGNYIDGKEDGLWNFYSKSHQKIEGIYKNGKEDGEWIEYDEKGRIIEEGSYKDGLKDGTWISWFRNQKMKVNCPKCKSNNVIPIVYGLPGYEMREDAIKGKIHLGGCVIEEDAPDFHCNDCEQEWIKVKVK